MEVYYKDLISKDASLDKLVEDLSRVVLGVEEFADAAGPELQSPELRTRLERLKEGCRRIRGHALEGAVATDRVLRRNPYSFAATAFALGLFGGILACKMRCHSK